MQGVHGRFPDFAAVLGRVNGERGEKNRLLPVGPKGPCFREYEQKSGQEHEEREKGPIIRVT